MKILIPFNFSESSKSALRFGINLALETESSIKVLHCGNWKMPSYDLTYSVDDLSFDRFKELASVKFQNLAPELPRGTSDVLLEFIVQRGDLVDLINEISEQDQSDLIIMGMGDSSGLSKTLFGNFTLEIMNSVELPVLAVPPNYERVDINNICIASDLSPDNVEDLTMARHFSAIHNAKVHLLNIDENPKDIDVDHSLVALGLHNFFKDVDHQFHMIQADKVDREIRNFVEKSHIDLLVVRPGDHWLLGKIFSHTRNAVAYQKIPVMSIHK